jgi:hypothetical protein
MVANMMKQLVMHTISILESAVDAMDVNFEFGYSRNNAIAVRIPLSSSRSHKYRPFTPGLRLSTNLARREVRCSAQIMQLWRHAGSTASE